ncbi:MAG: ABC transporter ATP-binding protein [Fibrobacterota bacterium]|nr:ABC transporter ATP-binding protein [Chitinispirillaceae bacterium]
MILALDNIYCGYGNEPIVSNLSTSITPGENICILGPNGVGKTTLFKSILGFLPLISGTITIDGEDIHLWPRKRLARYLGYVPQAHIPPFPFRVLDVVSMGCTSQLGMFASPSKNDFIQSERLLDTMGILHLKNRIYTELSGGERQMVIISRALAQNPKILIMDEPTANLDFGNQICVLTRINELTGQGLAVIMTSHVPDHAFLCNSSVILLQRDNKYSIGPADTVITEKKLLNAYNVSVKIADFEHCSIRQKCCIPIIAK